MSIKFKKVSDFDGGILFELLKDEYSFDCKYEQACRSKWQENDDFFFDNLQIADKYCFITTLNDEVIGFVAWDPRNMPEYVEIGDNCIVSKHKGNGYGKLQLQIGIIYSKLSTQYSIELDDLPLTASFYTNRRCQMVFACPYRILFCV